MIVRLVFPFLLTTLALLSVLPSTSSATTDTGLRWVQRHYGPADGLPVSSATSARVDPDGFLWLATHDGLARFDGERFDVHDSMRFPAMSGNRVLSVHDDGAGRLYALSAHGDWLRVQSGRIDRVDFGIEPAPPVHYIDVTSLCLTTARAMHCPDGTGSFPLRVTFPDGIAAAQSALGRHGDSWLVSVTGEVWRHDGSAWRRVWQPPSPGAHRGTPHLVSTDGSYWVVIAGSLLRIVGDRSEVIWEGLRGKRQILQLREDAGAHVWIGTDEGVYRAAPGQLPRLVFADQSRGEDQHHLSWHAPDGAVWIRAGHRLWRFAGDADGFDPAEPPIMDGPGRPQELLFAEDGAVWVMSLRGGLYRLVRARVELLDESSVLGGGNVYGVTRDHQGTMWMGTLGAGVKGLDVDGRVHHLGADDGLPGNNPWLVAAAPDGALYVGTYAPGLWRRPPQGGRFEPVPLPDELFGEQVLAVHFDADDALWVGTTAGAWRRDHTGWRRQWPTDPARHRVNALAMSDSGEVWFGGSNGVWRQHRGNVHTVAHDLLANTSVRDLFRGSDGALWISTDGRGLIRVGADDSHGVHAVRLGRAQGLPSNSPHAVRQDAEGNLWVNSNQGIFRIGRANLADLMDARVRYLTPLILGLADGLTELEGNGGVQPSAAFDRTGRLWFPSQRGVVRFDPQAMPIRDRAPKAVIDGLESQGEPVLTDVDTQALPLGVRSLTVRYSAADLHAGAALRFRYRLAPIEQGWTDTAGSRTATFAGLAPGHYRFELVAGNSDGVWSNQPTVLEFRVPAYWFEQRAVRIAGMALLALLVFGVIRLRGYQLRQRTIELDRQVHERTAELRTEKGKVEQALSELSGAHDELAQTHRQIEDSNLRLAEQAQRLEALDKFRTRLLADVSHELRTPVMLVSMPLRELESQSSGLTGTQREKLNLSMRQLDRLGGLVEQLVGLVQVESGQMPMRAGRVDMATLLRELIVGYQPIASRAGVGLTLHTTADTCVVMADRQHLTTVFGNLVDNAIKHAPTGSNVELGIRHDEEEVMITVVDHGPGFDAEVARRLFERFYRAAGPPRRGREGLGIGLALARELVELHGGRITAHSVPGAGATFQVTLPMGSAHLAIEDLALEPGSGAQALPAPMADRGEGRVLLVEDHPDLAAYLSDRLGEHLPVTCVGSAEEAMQALAEDTSIRLVISDVVLPGRSGLDLCRTLQAASMPVILISAKAAEHDRQVGMDAGAVAYLAKPFGFEALLEQVARAWPAVAPRLSATPTPPDAADPLLTLALDRLADAEFTVADWAARAFLSERQLRRRVNDLTGQSPQTWLREQRLLRVRHLLGSGECKTLAEAGARCGFDNPAWLYRCYRARFGTG